MQQAMATNKQRLRNYQWIETTTITVDGKPRPPRQSICKYTEDGTLEKTGLGQQEARAEAQRAALPLRGGLIKKLMAKKKKGEFQEDLKQIHALTELYMPFDRAKFKEALAAGQVDLEHDGTTDDVVIINNYAKKGDQLRLTLNQATMQVERISVKTYFDKPKEVLTAKVQYSTLGDGTRYTAVTTIDAPSKKLSVARVNSDFSKPAS